MTTQSDQRTEVGLTQDQAARRAGVSVATWRRWERDPSSVSPEVGAQCQEALDAVDDDLWDDFAETLRLYFPTKEPTLAEKQAQLEAAYENLAAISFELFSCRLKPSGLLRSRFGRAVTRVRMCQVLAEGRPREEAADAVAALYDEAGLASAGRTGRE